MKYLIVETEELDDQYECDAHRTPLFVTENLEEACAKKDYPFEIWAIKDDNSIVALSRFNEMSEFTCEECEEEICPDNCPYENEFWYDIDFIKERIEEKL